MTQAEALERVNAVLALYKQYTGPVLDDQQVNLLPWKSNASLNQLAEALLRADREARIDELRRMARERCKWCRKKLGQIIIGASRSWRHAK